jgi:hypothetical protein
LPLSGRYFWKKTDGYLKVLRYNHRMNWKTIFPAAFFLTHCGGGTEDTADSVEPEMEELFSFVVLADPHIAGPLEHEQRLEKAVNWINAAAAERAIEVVVVVGDIGWGAGLERSRELLDALEVTYVPLIGDNEVQTDDELRYTEVYASQFERLEDELDEWMKVGNAVVHPDSGEMVWLQNLRFEHKGVLFVGIDTIVRGVKGTLGELGTLNDYPGGSWPFLEEVLSDAEFRPFESIVLAGHVPIMLGALDVQQMAEVATTIGPVGEWVYAHYAGHLHVDYEATLHDQGIELFVTDATWDDHISLRVVTVSGNGVRMEYAHESIWVDAL